MRRSCSLRFLGDDRRLRNVEPDVFLMTAFEGGAVNTSGWRAGGSSLVWRVSWNSRSSRTTSSNSCPMGAECPSSSHDVVTQCRPLSSVSWNQVRSAADNVSVALAVVLVGTLTLWQGQVEVLDTNHLDEHTATLLTILELIIIALLGDSIQTSSHCRLLAWKRRRNTRRAGLASSRCCAKTLAAGFTVPWLRRPSLLVSADFAGWRLSELLASGGISSSRRFSQARFITELAATGNNYLCVFAHEVTLLFRRISGTVSARKPFTRHVSGCMRSRSH